MRTSGLDGKNREDGGTQGNREAVKSGTGNSRDGNKTSYDRMIEGRDKTQRQEGLGNRGRAQNSHCASRPVPVPTFAARIPENCPCKNRSRKRWCEPELQLRMCAGQA